jgi:hypothetical protein
MSDLATAVAALLFIALIIVGVAKLLSAVGGRRE